MTKPAEFATIANIKHNDKKRPNIGGEAQCEGSHCKEKIANQKDGMGPSFGFFTEPFGEDGTKKGGDTQNGVESSK